MAHDESHDPSADEPSADELGADPFFDEEHDDDDDEWGAPAPSRGTTMRHPVLLVLVVIGSVFMFIKTWPKVDYMIAARTPTECGDLSQRPEQRSDDPAGLPPLPHDTHCHVRAHVQRLSILATGASAETGDPSTDNAGRKYYLKLDGDKVFGVIAADRPDVINFRLRRGNLLGFEVDTVGRMIDPDQEPELRATAKTLRVKFGVPDSEPIRIFDTTQQPGDRWPYVAICVLMVFTALLALFGLLRVLRVRRED